MKQIDISAFDQSTHIYFIGIGGISMSGLAEILLERGCSVSGSDMKETALTRKLSSMGAKVYIGHSAENVPKDCDLVVYSAAIKPENSERMRAEQLGIPSVDRATLLGAIMKCYPYAVAVSGTHGKTTTTGMLAYVLMEGNTDPTVSIGGELDLIDGNIRTGNSDYFVTEACEYCESFLKFFPYIAVITNVEEDHLDYYTGIDHIISAFHKLALLVPEDGAIVVNYDNENAKKALIDVPRPLISYAIDSEADWTAKNITFNSLGQASFDAYYQGELYTRIDLHVVGIHNVSNALAVLATAHKLGISKEQAATGLTKFGGTKRRFEYKGQFRCADIIDDYAHHPTEIRATLTAVKQTAATNVWCVFQPHTYTRTKAFLNEFADALSGDIRVIVTDIYAAREKDTGMIHAKDLAQKIPNSVYISDFCDIVSYLKEHVSDGDLILTMGAGNVEEIGPMLLKEN